MTVRVVCDGIAKNTKITTEDGSELEVAAADVRFRPDEFVRVSLELAASSVDIAGEPVFYVTNPSTGAIKKVCRIIFDDGSDWIAP